MNKKGCLSLFLFVFFFVIVLSLSFAAIGSGDVASGILLIILGLLGVVVYFNNMAKNKNNTSVNNTRNEEQRKHSVNYSKPFINFTPTQIKQILETIDIIENTEHLDILTSRIEFLSDLLRRYLYARGRINHNDVIQKGVELYKHLYYNRVITDTQIKILKDPTCIGNEYYSNNVIRCFMKYSNTMQEQIDSLKTEKAKERRKEKISNTARLSIQELIKYHQSDKIELINNRLKDFNIMNIQYLNNANDIISASK